MAKVKPKPKPDNQPSPPETVADLGEFGFIDSLRKLLPEAYGDLQIGIGDDAAWWRPSSGNGILTTTDMLVSGVHFDLKTASAADIGYKALAVNLSDLAAMGGQPVCVYLGLGLPPELEKSWLKQFVAAFLELAQVYEVQLAGGDTVAAQELVISVTLTGILEAESPLRRSGASVGDDIYLSGTVGDSCLGLRLLQNNLAAAGIEAVDIEFLQNRHLRPEPRLTLGLELAASGRIGAALDVSDGLLADLGHILTESGGLGAEIDLQNLPLSAAARRLIAAGGSDYDELISGGEDFELLFTAVPAAGALIREISGRSKVPVTRIGRITAAGLILLLDNGSARKPKGRGGYDHFSS